MTRKSSKQLKFVAFFMSLVMLMTVAPFSAFAEDGVVDTSESIDQVLSGDEIISDVEPAAAENAAALTAADVPEFIALSDLTSRGTIRRVYEEEADLSTILFENNDGTRTLYMYGVPVKYVAPDGTTRDKSTAISSLSGLQALWNGSTLAPCQMTTLAQNASIGHLDLDKAADALTLMSTRLSAAYGSTLRLSDMAYASLDSDIRSLYPTAVSDGVVLNYGDYSIRTIPVATGSLVLPGAANIAESTSLTDNDVRTRVRYSNAFGLGTILQYTPTTMGVKEEIILTSNVGKNSFSFRIETGGLTIEEENGSYYFFDPETQSTIARLGEVIAYDSNGQIARGTTEVVTIREGQQYGVTISVSEEFLAEAVYPVSVDPTINIYEINYYGTLIEDNAVYSDAGAWGYTFDSFHYVGKVNYTPSGESYSGQALYRFPALYDSSLLTDYYWSLSSLSVNSFELHLKTGLVDENTTLYVNPYVPVWQNSPRICNSAYYDYYDMSRYNIEVSNVPNAGSITINITDIAREWLDLRHNVSDYTLISPQSGILIRNADPNKVCILTAIEESSDVYVTLDYSSNAGTYYMNNAATRTFLGGAEGASGSSTTLESGLMATIGDDVTWTFRYQGNSQFYIQSTANPSNYIGSNGKLTTTPFKWTVTSAPDGGVHIYRIVEDTGAIVYLGVNSSGNVVASSALSGDQIKWRKMLTSLYDELLSIDIVEQLVISLQTETLITIDSFPINASWNDNEDFTIAIKSGLSSLTINNSAKTIYSQSPGKATIEVMHIPTGICVDFEIVFYKYTWSIQHYYDEGFVVRHGSSALSLLESYNDKVAKYLASNFLLKINATYIQTESLADEFVKAIDGEIDATDIALTEDCVARDELRDDFINDVGVGTNTLTKMIWTGHCLENNARSASYSSDFVVIMTALYTSEGVLIHELSHQLGTYDHYCEGDGEPCSIETCDVCSGVCNPARDCIMTQSNINNGHCDDCISIINEHLEDHH